MVQNVQVLHEITDLFGEGGKSASGAPTTEEVASGMHGCCE